MEGLTALQELDRKRNKLDRCTDKLAELADKYGNAEKEYRVALASKILELKAQEYPATLIVYMAKGDNNVALKKMEQIVAKGNYNACMEMINTLKLQIKIIQETLNKEYFRD